jgi:hypothetical protein
MIVVSPVVSAEREVQALASRPPTLRGRRIALLDNSKPNAGALLDAVAQALVERAGAGPVVRFTKPGSALAAPFVDELVGAADVVLTASAD